MILLNIFGGLLLPALGLALYRMGYEAGRQAAQDAWEDGCDDDGPIVMEHTHGGEDNS